MDVYTLIAYKRNSVDMCMGCRMDSYYSDFEYASFIDNSKLIALLTELFCRNKQLRINEVGYQILIYRNGRLCWDNGFTWDYLIDYEDDIRDRAWLEVGDMIDIAKADCETLLNKIAKEKIQEEQTKQRAAAEALKNKELAELKKLQEKYGQQN